MIAILCNSAGDETCGSDNVICIDGRLSIVNRLRVVAQYRQGFKLNFPHKYSAWTHCYFVSRIGDRPTVLFGLGGC